MQAESDYIISPFEKRIYVDRMTFKGLYIIMWWIISFHRYCTNSDILYENRILFGIFNEKWFILLVYFE